MGVGVMDFNEAGVTNLGPVPRGMTFAQAIAATRGQRKYQINPYEGGHRLTICDTIRHTWRILDTMPDSAEKEQIYEYLRAMADFAKRMDARMKELKGMINEA